MAGCTPDLHVFIYSGLIASYKPKPGERCICGEYSVEEMEAKGKTLSKLEAENNRLLELVESAEWFEIEIQGPGGVAWYQCPWCKGKTGGSQGGHKPDCPGMQALVYAGRRERSKSC